MKLARKETEPWKENSNKIKRFIRIILSMIFAEFANLYFFVNVKLHEVDLTAFSFVNDAMPKNTKVKHLFFFSFWWKKELLMYAFIFWYLVPNLLIFEFIYLHIKVPFISHFVIAHVLSLQSDSTWQYVANYILSL